MPRRYDPTTDEEREDRRYKEHLLRLETEDLRRLLLSSRVVRRPELASERRRVERGEDGALPLLFERLASVAVKDGRARPAIEKLLRTHLAMLGRFDLGDDGDGRPRLNVGRLLLPKWMDGEALPGKSRLRGRPRRPYRSKDGRSSEAFDLIYKEAGATLDRLLELVFANRRLTATTTKELDTMLDEVPLGSGIPHPDKVAVSIPEGVSPTGTEPPPRRQRHRRIHWTDDDAREIDLRNFFVSAAKRAATRLRVQEPERSLALEEVKGLASHAVRAALAKHRSASDST